MKPVIRGNASHTGVGFCLVLACLATGVTVSGYLTADTDGDGIADSWASNYFGFSPLLNGTGPGDKLGDLDGDGQSNYAEFLAGTDPTDVRSVFGITSISLGAEGSVVVRFRDLPGRNFRVFYSTNLTAWAEVLPAEFRFPASGVVEWVDDGSYTGILGAQRFYRVTAE